jgi:hypothetical protein
VLDRKYRTVINWSELGWKHPQKRYLVLLKLELKYPNFTWEHNLLKLCAELEQYKSCLSDGGARTSTECSSRIGSHCNSCSKTDVFLEQDIVWTEWEHKTDIGVPEFPCSS